jgi:hypothetical protein
MTAAGYDVRETDPFTRAGRGTLRAKFDTGGSTVFVCGRNGRLKRKRTGVYGLRLTSRPAGWPQLKSKPQTYRTALAVIKGSGDEKELYVSESPEVRSFCS